VAALIAQDVKNYNSDEGERGVEFPRIPNEQYTQSYKAIAEVSLYPGIAQIKVKMLSIFYLVYSILENP